MAFQNVNVSNTRKATEIEVGASITGYVVRFEASRSIEGQVNMVLQGEDGQQFVLFSAGNLKYMINDGKIKEGVLTRITRLADRVVKGKKSTNFSVEQDPDNTIATAPKLSETIGTAALAAKTSSIAAQAGRLTSAVNNKRG